MATNRELLGPEKESFASIPDDTINKEMVTPQKKVSMMSWNNEKRSSTL